MEPHAFRIGGAGGAAVSVAAVIALDGNGLGDTRHGANARQFIGTITIFALVGGLIGSAFRLGGNN